MLSVKMKKIDGGRMDDDTYDNVMLFLFCVVILYITAKISTQGLYLVALLFYSLLGVITWLYYMIKRDYISITVLLLWMPMLWSIKIRRFVNRLSV